MGVLDRRDRDKNNAIGLKEGRVIQIETTVLPLRDARSPSLCNYLRSTTVCSIKCSTNLSNNLPQVGGSAPNSNSVHLAIKN